MGRPSIGPILARQTGLTVLAFARVGRLAFVPGRPFLGLPYIFSIAALVLAARRADDPRVLMKPCFEGQR